jgi:hypothetical protein
MATFINETKSYLDELRKSSFALENLPDEIAIPAMADGVEAESKPLLLATVDDIAFAQQGLNQALSRIVEQIESLRRVHDMARGLGAKGADYTLEYLRKHGEVK